MTNISSKVDDAKGVVNSVKSTLDDVKKLCEHIQRLDRVEEDAVDSTAARPAKRARRESLSSQLLKQITCRFFSPRH